MLKLIRAEEGRGGGRRDLRADVFRGLALWFIFIDHVPGNRLGGFTLRNFALCDATEAFVLLAGYAAGLAYGSVLDRQGWSFAAAALLRRAGTLYIAHIFLFVVFTAQVGYSAAALDSAAYLDELHLDAFGEQPYRALLEALLLRFQPAFLDILPLYIVLLLMLVPGLLLLHRPWLLVALSMAVYLAVRTAGVNLPSWTGGGWFLNPLAWQALFFVGCALGGTRRAGDPPRSRIRVPPSCPAPRCWRWAPRWWSLGSGPNPCPTCRSGSLPCWPGWTRPACIPSGCSPSWRSPTCWATGWAATQLGCGARSPRPSC